MVEEIGAFFGVFGPKNVPISGIHLMHLLYVLIDHLFLGILGLIVEWCNNQKITATIGPNTMPNKIEEKAYTLITQVLC